MPWDMWQVSGEFQKIPRLVAVTYHIGGARNNQRQKAYDRQIQEVDGIIDISQTSIHITDSTIRLNGIICKAISFKQLFWKIKMTKGSPQFDICHPSGDNILFALQ